MAAHRKRAAGPKLTPVAGRPERTPNVPADFPSPPVAQPGELLTAILAECALCAVPASAQQAISLARAIESNPPAHTLAALHRALTAARAEVLLATPPPEQLDIIDLLRRRMALLSEVNRDQAEGLLSPGEADAKRDGIRAALAMPPAPPVERVV